MSQPTAESLIAAGAAALRAGERERARQLLAQAVRADPRSPQAWLFLAGAVTDVEQRRACLERVLSLSPGHPAAQRGLASLGAPAPHAPAASAKPDPAPPAPRLQSAPARPDAAPTPPPAPAFTPSPASPQPPATPAGDSLLQRLYGAATQTTAVAAPQAAPPAPQPAPTPQPAPAPRPGAQLFTLPLEPPAAPQARDRRLWLALLALGVLLMLIGLAMAAVALS